MFFLGKGAEEKQTSGKKSGSTFMSKELPKSVKMKLKGGGFVDPESGLEEKAHVLKVKSALYSVVLGAVSIQEDKNSFYKLQVLEHDKKPKWWLFRSWVSVQELITAMIGTFMMWYFYACCCRVFCQYLVQIYTKSLTVLAVSLHLLSSSKDSS